MFLFTCYVLGSILANANDVEPCESPQYVVYGQAGTIQCNFTAGYFGIFWYNTTDYINEYSVLNLKQSGTDGPGYKSGEFDILPNGSLIITKVTFAHNRNFTVVKLDSAFEEVVPHFVTVVVKAFPNPPYPIIGGCQQQRSCAVKVAHRGNLTCSVLGIHPLVELTWEMSRKKSYVNLLQTIQSTTRRSDGRFDVHLMSEYFINNTSEYSHSVKCVVVSSEGAPTFDLQSKIFLLFPEGFGITEHE